MLPNFNAIQLFFLACAILGGIFFVFWLIMQFVGLGDFDTELADIDDLSADASFKLLSLQGLTAFAMMFGLVGLGLYRPDGIGTALGIGGGFMAGLSTVWIIGRIWQLILKLQSSGTLSIEKATGCFGTVYLHIPAGGVGSVQINFANRIREFDACAEEELATGVNIRVVAVSGSILKVEKA